LLLHIIARGKIGSSPEAELVERYASRILWPLRLTELPERDGRIPNSQAPFRTVVLDERGRNLTSDELARQLEAWRDGAIREVRFMIGAADGHSDLDRAGADLLLSFGAATWPHQLVRIMLAEQLYRACTIQRNEKYHHI